MAALNAGIAVSNASSSNLYLDNATMTSLQQYIALGPAGKTGACMQLNNLKTSITNQSIGDPAIAAQAGPWLIEIAGLKTTEGCP